MKKAISIVLTIMLLLSAVPSTVLAEGTIKASGSCGDKVNWILFNDGKLQITGTGPMREFWHYTQYGSITAGTPWDSSAIITVSIGEGITYIGGWAFNCCKNLTSVSLPSSLVSIGEKAFFSCVNLQEIEIPNSVTKIGKAAFSECKSLPSVKIGDNIATIEDDTFSYCNSLKSISIGKNVKKFGGTAFRFSKALQRVDITDLKAWCEIEQSAGTEGCTPLMYGANLYLNGKMVTDLIIPDGITTINNWKFYHCNSIRSVIIPESVTSIDSGAFRGCNNLTYVEIPNSVKNIGGAAFRECSGLTSITIPNGVSIINTSTFSQCKSLKSVTIPITVGKIDNDAFSDCTALKKVYFGGNGENWANIKFGSNNGYLQIADIFYNHGSHTYDNGTITVEPSFEEAGSITYACTVCGEIKTEPLTMEPISFDVSKAKTNYYHHDDLDLNGLKVLVKYSNGQNSSRPVTADMVKSGNTETVGENTITLSYNGVTASYKIRVEPLPVSSVSLNQTTLSLDEGATAKLTASISPANATDSSITWSSDDDSVATVDQNGKVKAVAKGTAAITAKAHNGKSATCMVTVLRPATTIDLDRSTVTLWNGDTDSLKATLSPADTTDGVAWSSDNTGVVKVDNTGKLTAVGKGTAIVTASTNRGLSASCSVSVKVHSTGVTLDKTALVINTGESVLLTANVTPQESDDAVTFTSSDSDVASVTAAGRVAAKAPGSAIITATTENGKTATCTVTVLQPATGIQLNKTVLTLDVTKTAKLTATLTPANTTDTVTYSSSDSSVATVSSDGTVTAKAKGTATITATSTSGKAATCTVTVLVPSTGIQLNKSSAAVYIGETLSLTATLTPAESTDTVTWTSSAPKIVSVSSDGVATAKAKGTATITATTTSGKSAVCEITALVAATSITLSKTSLTMNKGETEVLTATLKPSDTTDTVSWKSDDSSVVSVSSDGKLTAKAKGSATITATATNGKSASCTVTVLVHSTGISLNNTSLTLDVNNTAKMTATLTPTDTTDTVSYTSSDSAVAAVSSDGTVTAKAKGTATITATTTSGKTAICKVTVLVPATGIQLNNTSLTLELKKTVKLTATLTPSDTTDTITYTSSDNSVATVSSNGTVTAKATGTATITATTTSGKTALCTVEVVIPATKIQLNKTSLTLDVTKTAKLTATLTPANTTDTVSYSSSDNAVAAVSSDGTVTAKAKGTATITATTTSGKTATCEVTVLVPATDIQLSNTSLTLELQKTAKVTASLTPADSTDSVAWSSSNAKVVSVSDDGTVTGVAVGTATITAKTDSGKSVSCSVTVSPQKVPAQAVSLNNSSLSLEAGSTTTLTATMTPENSTDALTWSSSDDSVSVVNGIVTANYPGMATITVKTESGKSASCTVTVTQKKVPAQSVSLNQVSLTLKAGQTATLTATLTPSNSTDTLDWSSSDTSVATVSNGTVTAKKAGTATITVTTESGKKASCNIIVPEETPIPPADNWTQSNQFWFANSSEHFRTGRYTISQSDLLKLNEYIKKNYSSGYAQSIINQITAERNSRWGGSCFGMAMASILDYTGQIGFNENFDKGKATLHDVSSPSTNTEVQSAINYYFMGQFIPMTRNANECYQKGTSAWSSGLKRLVNKAKDNQIMLFCYFFRLGGHAIVIKGYNGTDSLGNHLLVSYDNRFPNRDVIVKVSADYSSCIINGDEYATAIEYLSDFDAYDKIDIDGPNNDLIIQSAINASAGQEKQGTEISVVADGDLMIQNKEGKNIVIKDGIITSTLDIISTHLIVHSTTEGDAAPPEIVFTVADSDYFTFESSAGTLSASMLTAETFSCVTAKNADSAILSTAEGVSVFGDSAEYTVFSSVEDDGCDMFSFSGVANGTANVRYENGSITVSGNTPGVITAGKYSDDEYEEFSFNSTKKTVSIKLVDTTNAVILGDVDGDGNITSADARLALRASVKLEDYAENSAKYLASDVNKDGKIGSDDARLILRASVKLEDPTKW